MKRRTRCGESRVYVYDLRLIELQNFEYKDPFNRPREKVGVLAMLGSNATQINTQILLLSGPAGFGKTTLAHIAAKQAGYDVMEINARQVGSANPLSFYV